MPTFKPVIRLHRERKDGTTNIVIRVLHKRKPGYIPTKYYILPKEFDSLGNKVNDKIKPKEDADKINMDLLSQIGEYGKKLSTTQEQIDLFSVPQLITYLVDKTDTRDLVSLLDRKVRQKTAVGNLNYAESFLGTKNCLVKLGYKTIPIDLITTQWIKELGDQMKIKGHSPNTIGHRMRDIRTVFNEADTGRYPFRGYKIPKAVTTEHRVLTIEQTALIAKKEIKEPLMRWSRDMYMLSFYLIGMNWRDLAFIKEVRDGRIYYTRSKGKKSYSIKVFPEAQAIIDRYPGKKYLLDLMDNYSNYRTGTKRIDKKLKSIAVLCNIDRPVSLYYARHSWSTIASESLGIPEDIVSRSLGHSVLKPINEITQIYIRKELKPCDDANEKVIKAILKNDDDDVITSLNL
jgi:integrase